MDAHELRELQKPLKSEYKEDPQQALVTLEAEGTVGDNDITCTVDTWAGEVVAGLHEATGGDGTDACSGDMLLQSLAACAGVTLKSIATMMDIPLRDARIDVEGDIDFRGTLGVSKNAPVGLTDIRVTFDLDTDASQETLDKLLELTERYCVVYQTLQHSPNIDITLDRRAADTRTA